jgi:CRP/FNR family transcriptional regulator, cyclic AMP receptor protein
MAGQPATKTKIETEPLATRVALHPFLAGMNPTQLALLTDCAMATHFNAGETILREGAFANRFYLIETGKVVLESAGNFRGPLVIETIGSGDLLGWSWMFPPFVWQFTARAIEPATVMFFYGTILRGTASAIPR